MSYQTLEKIFHKSSHTEYKRQFMIRSESPATLHLPLTIRGNNEELPLFVVTTVELTNKLCKIYRLNKRFEFYLNNLPPVAISHYKQNCLIEEILKTNEMEGVRSTRREIKDVLEGHDDKFKRFYGLVKKYLMLQSDTEFSLKTAKDIRELYDEIVLPEIDEEDRPDGIFFRKDIVNVISSTQKVLHKGVVPEENIISAITEMLNFLNHDDCEDLIKTAIVHYYFGYIHPFYDGNGRVSRFISSYLLSQQLNPAISFKLSISIQRNIKEYYKGFTDVNNPLNLGDATPFCLMFLSMIEHSLKDGIAELREKIEQIDFYFQVIDRLDDLSPIEEDILFILSQGKLFDVEDSTIQELVTYLSSDASTPISQSTVRKYIKKLLEKQYIIESKRGKMKTYSLANDFENYEYLSMINN